MDVKALQARIAAFAAERGWNEVQNPRNLAIAIAGEAGMLLDLFRWLTDAQSHRIQSEYKRDAAEEAIADLLLHTLRLADKLGVDVERAVAKKLAENDANYPPPAPEPPVAARVMDAPKPAAPAARESAPPPAPTLVPAPMPAPAPVTKAPAPHPSEPKAASEIAPAPEPVAKAPEPKPAVKAPEPKPVAEAKPAEPKAPAENALPNWLDGIMPTRAGSGRKKQTSTRAVAEPPPPDVIAKAPDSPPPPAPAPPPGVARIEAAPPPAAAPGPASGPASEPLRERYPNLDAEAAKVLAKALAKRIDGARSDDPLLRELHDEVETLRRTLYSPTPKRSWIGDSLKTIRAVLEEATTHEVGLAIRAHEYIAQIGRILEP